MYVKPGCPWCERAREAMAAEGLDWEERDATASPEFRRELFDYSGGSGIVPTIVGPEGTAIGWEGKG
jgi:glutaredoxin 3